jgi:multimeric flavodoxin WrbA
MNIVVLHGSARVGGDSDTLAQRVLDGLAVSGNHRIQHFRPIEMQIEHCRACGRCSAEGRCILEDDMRSVYPAFCEADIVVLAAPMFWGYMTSQLKTLFDRLEAVASTSCFGGKRFVLVATYRHYYGSMVEWLERTARGFGSESHVILCRTFDPVSCRDIPATALPGKMDEAFALGERLGRQTHPA